MSDALSSLLLLAGIYLAVLASPGPNFFILSQMALDGLRRQARWTVYGITTSSVVWVSVALTGLSALLAAHPGLATVLRLLGGSYLLWIGSRLLWSALHPPKPQGPAALRPELAGASAWQAYRAGLLTGMTNPKGAAFWTGVFAAVYPAAAPAWFEPVTVALVALLSLGWHLGITIVFGLPALQKAYLRAERAVNGLAGGMLLGLGLQRMTGR